MLRARRRQFGEHRNVLPQKFGRPGVKPRRITDAFESHHDLAFHTLLWHTGCSDRHTQSGRVFKHHADVGRPGPSRDVSENFSRLLVIWSGLSPFALELAGLPT